MKTPPTALLGTRRLGAALTALALMVGSASAEPASHIATALPGTMQADLASRGRAIHWPEGFNPETADLFSHNALLIHASCEKVWSHIVDAKKWPQWYPNAKDVALLSGETVLGEATAWRWTTFGLPIESRVHEFVPYTRLGWYGFAPGAKPSFYHTWLLSPQGADCMVVMDEAGIGQDAAHLRETDESLMHRGHDLWLATLKWVAEGK